MTDKQKMTFKALTTPLKSQQVKSVIDEFYPITWKKSHAIILLAAAGLISGWVAATYLTTDPNMLVLVVFGFVMTFAIIVHVSWIAEIRLRTQLATRHIRLRNFAKENDFEYTERTVEPPYAGIVFGPGSYATALDQFRSKGPNPFEVGNCRNAPPDPNHERDPLPPDGCGYIHMKLERRVAHFIFQGGFDALRTTDATLAFEQVLGLEGDFHKWFEVYAPKGYERDALYVLTPDFMAVLADQVDYVRQTRGTGFAVEIVEDDLYIYSQKYDFLDEQTWQLIFRLVSAIGSKTISRTDLYFDEKVGEGRAANVIAKDGRRLKEVFSWDSFWLYAIPFLMFIGMSFFFK